MRCFFAQGGQYGYSDIDGSPGEASALARRIGETLDSGTTHRPPGWDQLVQLLVHVQDPQHMDELLRLLLTLHEQESLANRHRIVHALLCSDQPQRGISKDLQVSIAKVTAGSNELKRISKSLKQLLREHMLAHSQKP